MPRPHSAATLQDVANLAGVSIRTVSRVLNHAPHVSAKTRAAVLEAVDTLQYTPNLLARSLVTRRTGAIAVTISDVESFLAARLMRGVMLEAQRLQYRVYVCSTYEKQQTEREYLASLGTHFVDGVIFASHIVRGRKPYGIDCVTTPAVTVNYVSEVNCARFVQGNFEDAHKATHHLLQMGRQRVAFINGPRTRVSAQHRYRGYQAALADWGIQPNPRWEEEGDFFVPGGYRAMASIWERARPDALFAANDFMAIGAMNFLKEKGVRIPDDVAVVGYDNTESSALVQPALTTIDPPLRELGEQAAQTLISLIDHSEECKQDQPVPITASTTVVSGKLVVRDSCGALSVGTSST